MRYFIPNRLAIALCAVAAFLFIPLIAFAQEVVVPAVSIDVWTQLIPVALAFVLPLILGAVKKLIIIEEVQYDGVIVYKLPAWFPKWLPMVLVPVIVFGADMLTQLLTGSPGLSPYVLAVLPPITSWLYNVAEQVRKASTGQTSLVVKVEGLPDGVTGV